MSHPPVLTIITLPCVCFLAMHLVSNDMGQDFPLAHGGAWPRGSLGSRRAERQRRYVINTHQRIWLASLPQRHPPPPPGLVLALLSTTGNFDLVVPHLTFPLLYPSIPHLDIPQTTSPSCLTTLDSLNKNSPLRLRRRERSSTLRAVSNARSRSLSQGMSYHTPSHLLALSAWCNARRCLSDSQTRHPCTCPQPARLCRTRRDGKEDGCQLGQVLAGE